MDTTLTEEGWLDAALLMQMEQIDRAIIQLLALRRSMELSDKGRHRIDEAIAELQEKLDELRSAR